MKFLRLSAFKVAMLVTMGILVVFIMDRAQRRPWTEFLRLVEYKLYDFRFKMRGTRQPGDDVAILAIDEKSIDDPELGRFPWPREKIAKAYENLLKDGAAVIANDIVFSEPDPFDKGVEQIWSLSRQYESAGLRNPEVLPQRFDERFSDMMAGFGAEKEAPLRGQIAELREELRRSAVQYSEKSRTFYEDLRRSALGKNDHAFADLLGRYPDNIVLGYFFFEETQDIEGLSEESYTSGTELIASSRITIARTVPNEGIVETEPYQVLGAPLGLQPNIEALSKPARYFGSFNAQQDLDGVIRSSRLLTKWREQLYPTLGLEAVRAFMRRFDPQTDIVVTYQDGVGVVELRLGEFEIPVDEAGNMLVNYYGPRKMFPHYSFTDAYHGNFEPGTFKDKLVFVGATAIAVYDLRTTPFQEAYPGVEIHASVAENLISQHFMSPPDLETLLIEVLLIFSLGLLLGLVVPRVRALLGAAVMATVFAGYVAANFYLFDRGMWLNLVYPALTLVLVYTGITLYRYVTEEREKKQIKSAFGLYLHPAMVEKLAEHPDSLQLGGERVELTAFFSDIEGFSSFSEGMEPENLVHFLNEYLTEMTEIAQKYDATVDKYIGDAIVAFYGAPLHYGDHAVKACHTALDMQEKLAVLRQKWREAGLPEVKMRIGLNTGQMVVGNMGSSKRFNYTMMGDSVNLAARLESGAKQYKVYNLIGEETERQAREHIETRWLDLLIVKGRTKPVTIFELLAKKGQLDGDGKWPEVLGLWKQGIDAYRGRQFGEAKGRFEQILQARPGDGPSKVYIERCQEFIATPPPEEWDGVWVATSK